MEPHSTLAAITAGALAGTLGAIPLSLLPGVQGDTFWVGMVAAFCTVFLLDSINTPKKSAAAVLLASLASGYASPIVSNWIAENHPSLVVAPDHSVLRMVSAVLIAVSVPLLIALGPQLLPIILRILNRKGDAL